MLMKNVGASEEGGAEKFGNGLGSLGRCGRGLHGKENLRVLLKHEM